MSRLLDRDDLAAKGIKYSAVQLWRKVKEGSFPKPVKLSASRNAWIESEIEQWLEDRVRESRPAEVA